jgi:heme-degrading monooxygenase HmoA
MQQVLIDLFRVPTESRPDFLKAANQAQSFIKTLPGFVDGYLYEQIGKEDGYDYVTTAVWDSEAALKNAQAAVLLENQKQGVSRQEFFLKLKIERKRAIYQRSPY